MAELVDAHVSGACVARRAGSSPVLGTSEKRTTVKLPAFFISVFFIYLRQNREDAAVNRR